MKIHILSSLGFLLYCINWLSAGIGLYVAKSRYNGQEIRSPVANSSTAPGVTILRPLRGVECNLYENLEASFLQDYPTFEILFSVAEKDDASIPIVQALMKKYPNVKAELIIGEEIVGVNPKINNLIRTYRQATYDILWIIDSNVLTNLGCLARSVSLLTAVPLPGHRQIGLVHHLPFAILPDSQLGSQIEHAYLSSTHAKLYLAINYVGLDSCVTGKSYAFKKSDLDRAVENGRPGEEGQILAKGEGGLASFGKFLGEDNKIGEALWQNLGMRHAMGSDLAGNVVRSMSVESYFKRRIRWFRIRMGMSFTSSLLEPLVECFLSGIMGSYIFNNWLSISPFIFFPIHTSLWYYIDSKVFSYLLPSSPVPTASSHLQQHAPEVFNLDLFKAWFLRESFAFPLWLIAVSGDKTAWRDNGEIYRVISGGTVERVEGDDIKLCWGDRIMNYVFRLFSKDEDSKIETFDIGKLSSGSVVEELVLV